VFHDPRPTRREERPAVFGEDPTQTEGLSLGSFETVRTTQPADLDDPERTRRLDESELPEPEPGSIPPGPASARPLAGDPSPATGPIARTTSSGEQVAPTTFGELVRRALALRPRR